MINPYLNALKLIVSMKDGINVVVVGANDGRINDPIYGFSVSTSDKSSVCLIEPNPTLIPYLKENYSSHPSHKIENCAVGKDETLTLYAIKEEFWEKFQPSYAKGWPLYRAATGITSATRKHLENALAAHTSLDPDEAIMALDVPSKELKTVLSELDWQTPIDVLQIDVEGHDDAVIYASSLQATRPKLVYFETCHIPAARIQALLTYLTDQNYKTYQIGDNALAVDSRFSMLHVGLNTVVALSILMKKVRGRLGGWAKRPLRQTTTIAAR